jgi:large subunit ribosomal protein L10
MDRNEKERVVADLTAQLRETDTLIVADYRGLTMPQIDSLRGRLIEHGARFTVVKNTLTRRAAEAAGADALLALLEGPSAIAFIASEGDMVAVAKALADSARETRVLEIRGGLMQGRTISGADVDELAKLPPFDVLRGQVLGAIVAPLQNLLGLVSAPLQDLVGLIDGRIEQLGGSEVAPEEPGAAEEAAEAPGDAGTPSEADAPGAEPAGGEPASEGPAGAPETAAPGDEAQEDGEAAAPPGEAPASESEQDSEEASDVVS